MKRNAFYVSISTANAAFTDDPPMEIARILRKLADRLENGETGPVKLMDINGNAVGMASAVPS